MAANNIDNDPTPEARKEAGVGLRKLRLRAAAVALISIAFGSLYFFVRLNFKDGIWRFDLYLFNKSLATASLFLISLMIMTGIGYFSRGPGRALAYRKHYGLAGFWLGLTHGLVSHALLPSRFPLSSWAFEHPVASATGIAALLLFGAMATSSNAEIKGRLGGDLWRKSLRYMGYAALVIACVHAGILKWASWTTYLRTFESVLPSLSLPVVLFAVAAVVLRIFVWRSVTIGRVPNQPPSAGEGTVTQRHGGPPPARSR